MRATRARSEWLMGDGICLQAHFGLKVIGRLQRARMDDMTTLERARMIFFFPADCVAFAYRQWSAGRDS